MINAEMINTCEKENLADLLPTLEKEDIERLVEWLSEKDNDFRYKCFLLLQLRSQQAADVYPYWNVFVDKLSSDNSYQRSIGLMLIAENVRCDEEARFEKILDLYLSFVDDEKPITVRQCVQSLEKVLPFKRNCLMKIIDKLLLVNILQRKESQQKILLLDILKVLGSIHKLQPDERIESYFQNALSGEILDKKAKKQAEGYLF